MQTIDRWFSAYVPAGHASHVDKPAAGATYPAAQGWHNCCPDVLEVPGEHSSHASCSRLGTDPGSHIKQNVAFSKGLYSVVPQLTQARPLSSPYIPFSHCTHASLAALGCHPGEHCKHLAPSTLAALSGHLSHPSSVALTSNPAPHWKHEVPPCRE